jgi:hypothetical protein
MTTTPPAGAPGEHPTGHGEPVHPIHVEVDSPDDLVGTPEAQIGNADIGAAAEEIELLGTHDTLAGEDPTAHHGAGTP